jgi:hypothetical protein
MSLLSAVRFAHECVRDHISSPDIVVDATLGNGHDAVFLCKLIGAHGTLYGFDIQQDALDHTWHSIQQEVEHIPNHLHLFRENHAMMESMIAQEHHGQISAIMFNLGYLPGTDHQLTTTWSTTRLALDASLRLIRKHGILTIVVYPGHPAGLEESIHIEQWSMQLAQQQYQVLRYQYVNQINFPPYVIAITKK